MKIFESKRQSWEAMRSLLCPSRCINRAAISNSAAEQGGQVEFASMLRLSMLLRPEAVNAHLHTLWASNSRGDGH